MRILSRRVLVQKSLDEVQRILRSSAYRFSKPVFSGHSFSMYCAKRYNGGIISLIPIKGTVVHGAQMLEVKLTVCAGLSFWIGGITTVLAIVGMFWCILLGSSRWVAYMGMLLFGFFILGQNFWEGSAILDRVEHKLCS